MAFKTFFPIVHWRANVMTCVSKDMINQYQKIFGKTKQQYVYNIVKTAKSEIRIKKSSPQMVQEKTHQIIVASGMLAEWKGFDDLIKAASILDKKRYNFKLIIIGSGPEKIFKLLN